MSQVITNAFEQYWQSSLAAEQPVVLDEFILADIPNLDINAPIDPDTVLPPESQIVHRQSVDQRGRVNNNAVAYTIVMDTTVGDFSFNAMYLRNKQNGVIGMIVYKGRETKLKTDQTTGQTGNSLVKSMLMGYDQAAEATLTHVDAGTWQIDYAARLSGMDEDIRQLQADLYGHHTFVGDGFKVVEKDGAYQVTQGVAIIGGLRVELKAPEVIHPGTKPIGVWVDVHRAGSLLSEHQNHFTIITSVADLTDHVDSNGYPHYVAKLGTVQADNTVMDGRGITRSDETSLPESLSHLAQADAMLAIASREALRRSYEDAGYHLRPSPESFKNGGTLTSASDVLLDEVTGIAYTGQGPFPQDVAKDTEPSSGGFVARDPEVLRNQLAAIDGASLVGGALYAGIRAYKGPATRINCIGRTNIFDGAEGSFFRDINDTTNTDNDGIILVDALGRRWKREFSGKINVAWFGASGTGGDDRPGIQGAIDYAWAKKGRTVLFPSPASYYSLQSVNPTKPTSCLVIPEPKNKYSDAIMLEGERPQTFIQVDIANSIHSAIYFAGFGTHKRLENLTVYGGTSEATAKVDYVLYGADDYHPNMTLTACQFYCAKVACLWLATYVTTMTNVQTAFSPIGIKVAGPGDNINAPVTSVTLNSCYALNHSKNGYYFGSATYCTFNSCAADHITGYAYHISLARGCAFNGCGAEDSYQIIDITVAQGVTINGIMTLSIGNDAAPPSDLIHIGGGTTASIAGVCLHNSKAYDKILHVGNAWNSECVTVLDNSFSLAQCSYLSNWNHVVPIVFVASQATHRDMVYNVTDEASFTKLLNDTLRFIEIRHNITIKFPSGDIPIGNAIYAFNEGVTGSGSITLEGTTATRLVTSGNGKINFGKTPGTLPIILKNISLFSNAISNNQFLYIKSLSFRLTASSSISSHNGYVQYAIEEGVDLYLDATSSINTNVYVLGEHSFRIAKGTAAPTSGKFPVGAMRYASNPDATRIGWMCTADNSNMFVPF